MRDKRLETLFQPLTNLPGIGAYRAKRLNKLVGNALIDILFSLPRDIITRQYVPKIKDMPQQGLVIFEGIITQHQPPSSSKRNYRQSGRPYRILMRDKDGDMLHLVFFHANQDYLKRHFPPNEPRIVSGKIEFYADQPQIVHPDFVEPPARKDHIPLLQPIYSLTEGITNRQMMRFIDFIIEKKCPDLPEWIGDDVLENQDWLPFKQAMMAVHKPDLFHEPAQKARQASLDLDFDDDGIDDNDKPSPALIAFEHHRKRLAYDELLANQLALALVRQDFRRHKGLSQTGDGHLQNILRQNLPFHLTNAQEQALNEIIKDMNKNERMLRLLQGDVGSGKTIVAVMAILNALESGKLAGQKPQAALLAPTEILARQHYDVIKPWLTQNGLNLSVALLLGQGRGMQAKERRKIIKDVEEGNIDILIGTHALFQDSITYHQLNFVVIDEQHRFGVHQRLRLTAKGQCPDVLVMTATPIPRTLLLSHYGDMEHSRLTEKPPGRKPIQTVILSETRLDELITRLYARLTNGDQAYWICPLIEENEGLDLIAAQKRHEDLNEIFQSRFGNKLVGRIGLIHGRMKANEKETIMASFAKGEISLLVATTVVEVGVDVPNANIMVIEHAEHFGLAQLHQLRGRVGRGEKQSSCVLLRSKSIGEVARKRLKILSESEDGLAIAELDMKLRGTGEVLGHRQSGLPEFKMANLATDHELMMMSARQARTYIKSDPNLTGEKGEALRLLLQLFQYDRAMQTIYSG